MSQHDCPHGLDLRKYARCFLCDPEPKLLDITKVPWSGGASTSAGGWWCSACESVHSAKLCPNRTTITYGVGQ